MKKAVEKVIRGAVEYQKMPKTVSKISPKPATPCHHAIMLSCMDARVHPSTITQTEPSNAVFQLRNPGNMLPNKEIIQKTEGNTHKNNSGTNKILSAELAALDLVLCGSIAQDVFVCGHSDCKAMEALLGSEKESFQDTYLHSCLYHYGGPSLRKFIQYKMDKKRPLVFMESIAGERIEAVIDPGNDLEPKDTLSQINVLQQLENISSHPNLKATFTQEDPAKKCHMYGMWYNVQDHTLWFFDKDSKTFKKIDEKLADIVLSKR